MNELYEEKFARLRSDVDMLNTQMNMMNPAAFIEFRGAVLSALKEFDASIMAIEGEARSAAKKAVETEIIVQSSKTRLDTIDRTS